MQPWVPFVALALLAVQVPHASGQELRFDRPQPEHQLLERLAGEWELGSAPSLRGNGGSPTISGTMTCTIGGETWRS